MSALVTRTTRRRRAVVGIGLGIGLVATVPAAGVATEWSGLQNAIAVVDPALLDLEADAGLAPASPILERGIERHITVQRRKQRRAAEQARRQAEAAAANVRQSVIDVARAQVGDAYVTGGEGPDVFDCSGLTLYAYAQGRGINLPHNTHAQWGSMDETWGVGEREPQPGDLVFFFNGADHVGLYIGDGMMIHAANPGTGVELRSVYDSWYASTISGFGRTN